MNLRAFFLPSQQVTQVRNSRIIEGKTRCNYTTLRIFFSVFFAVSLKNENHELKYCWWKGCKNILIIDRPDHIMLHKAYTISLQRANAQFGGVI